MLRAKLAEAESAKIEIDTSRSVASRPVTSFGKTDVPMERRGEIAWSPIDFRDICWVELDVLWEYDAVFEYVIGMFGFFRS